MVCPQLIRRRHETVGFSGVIRRPMFDAEWTVEGVDNAGSGVRDIIRVITPSC